MKTKSLKTCEDDETLPEEVGQTFLNELEIEEQPFELQLAEVQEMRERLYLFREETNEKLELLREEISELKEDINSLRGTVNKILDISPSSPRSNIS